MAALAVLVLLVAGCGGGSKKTTTPSSSASFDEAAARQQVTQAYETFFAAKTPLSTRVSLLQDGAQLKSAIQSLETNPIAKGLSAKVTQVTFPTHTTATVKYEILGASGSPLLPNASGQALFVGGKWLVAKASFCQLVSLSGTTPAACK
jgi:hypothetical protein